MINVPEFSVLLPCYNAEAFISEALESLLNQSYPHFEVIAVDDGSHDSTLAILEDFASRDDRIKVLSTSNRGVSAARNLAFRESANEWIIFLDADDFYDPERLCELSKMITQLPQADFLFHDCYRTDEMGSRFDATFMNRHERYMRDIQKYCIENDGRMLRLPSTIAYFPLSFYSWPNVATACIRRLILEQHKDLFDQRFEIAEDIDLWVRSLKLANGIYYLDVPLSSIRRHSLSATHDDRFPIKLNTTLTILYEEHRVDIPKFYREALRLRISENSASISYSYRCQLQPLQAIKYALLALRYRFTKFNLLGLIKAFIPARGA